MERLRVLTMMLWAQVYEETFAMMMSRLGDTSVDRIAALFIQMKGSRLSWEDAVRDAEAR